MPPLPVIRAIQQLIYSNHILSTRNFTQPLCQCCSELNTLKGKSKTIEEKVEEIDKAMEFANVEIEGLKKKDKKNEDKIEQLEDKLLYQEAYNRRENLRFSGIP